jgi:O-antigen chain-terminating methyltransferase
VLRQSIASGQQQQSSNANAVSGSSEPSLSHRNLAVLRCQPNFETNAQNVYALEEFMQLHDTSFVEAAYLAILHREPDTVGRIHYVRRIREGASKIRVLSDLIRSKEGRSKGTKIVGLNAALTVDKLLSIPVIGGLFHFLLFSATIRSHFREMRVLENHIVRLAEESHRLHRQEIQRLETIMKGGQ